MAYRTALFMFLLLCAAACSESSSPTALPVPQFDSVALYGVVSSPTGACLEGAVIELRNGSRAGERIPQTFWSCQAVEFEDSLHAFIFHHVPRGSAITVRASKPGFDSQDVVWEPSVCCSPNGALRITLQPTNGLP